MARKLISFAVLLLAAMPASAHRGHDALSVVTLDGKGGVVVSHRFEAHDVEPALAKIAPDAQPSLDDPEAVAALVAYVGRRFTLASEHGSIALAPGEIDISGAEVRIAFAGRARGRIRRLSIASRVLTDIYPGQVNQVNVRVGKVVRTLTFRNGSTQAIEVGGRAS